MPDELTFTIADTSGNTLHFDRFAYERSIEAARGEYFDANWLRCRITLQVRVEPFNRDVYFKHSVNAQFLTTELAELSEALSSGLAAPEGKETTFEPMEPHLELKIEWVNEKFYVTARLDLAPGNGPVIEFDYESRPEEIQATIRSIKLVMDAFPERRLS